MAAELFEEHSAMLQAAEEFLAAVKRTPRIPLDQLSRKRVRMSSLIRQHSVTEETFIFGPLTREGGFDRLPHLEPIVQELRREKVLYSKHIGAWNPEAIERDWTGYVDACEVRIEAFKRILLEEEKSIYQPVLNLKASQMPLRA